MVAVEAGKIRDKALKSDLLPCLQTICADVSPELGIPKPRNFSESLNFQVRLHGLSRTKAANRVGVQPGLMNSWCNGEKQPGNQHIGTVSNLEKLFDLTPGYLSNKIVSKKLSAKGIAIGIFQKQLRTVKKRGDSQIIAHRASAAFWDKGIADQIVEVAKIAEQLQVETQVSRDKSAVKRDSYILRNLPENLEGEIEGFLSYCAAKCDGTHGTISLLDEASVSAERTRILLFLGFCCIHFETLFENPSERPELGLHLVFISALRTSYLRFLIGRKVGNTKDALKPSRTDRQNIMNARAMLSGLDGWASKENQSRGKSQRIDWKNRIATQAGWRRMGGNHSKQLAVFLPELRHGGRCTHCRAEGQIVFSNCAQG